MHILLIEDLSPLAPYIHRTLEEDGFHVVSTPVHTAIRFLSTADWKLIILDKVLPSEEGTDIVRHIKKECVNAKILVLSEHSAKQTEDDIQKIGLNHILQKPFPFQLLTTKIRELISSAPEKSGELRIDTLSIDVKSHAVYRDGKDISLTKKELLLILYLIRNKENAVSRSDLLEHVWGMQIDPLSNTIEAHILSLRKKIDFAGQNKLIHTIPKFGYKLSTQR